MDHLVSLELTFHLRTGTIDISADELIAIAGDYLRPLAWHRPKFSRQTIIAQDDVLVGVARHHQVDPLEQAGFKSIGPRVHHAKQVSDRVPVSHLLEIIKAELQNLPRDGLAWPVIQVASQVRL